MKAVLDVNTITYEIEKKEEKKKTRKKMLAPQTHTLGKKKNQI
jgi:hypothetical protein